MKFNINNYVRVKLTDRGRENHRKNHDELFAGWSEKPEYRPPVEDAEGWSKWQMWSLMADFGPHISIGMNPPFETEIEIIEAP